MSDEHFKKIGQIVTAALTAVLVGTSAYLGATHAKPILTLSRSAGEKFVLSTNQFAEGLYNELALDIESGSSQLAAISFSKIFTVPSYPSYTKTVKQSANIILGQARNSNIETLNNNEYQNSNIETKTIAQITEIIRPFDLASLKAELMAEIEQKFKNYTPTQTLPAITRQSNADAGRRGTIINNITESGTLTNPTITGATVSGPTGTFTSLNFTTGSGTSATTTNFFSTTASSTNLFASTATIGNLTVTSCATCGDRKSVV